MGIVIGSPLQQGALARRYDEQVNHGAVWLSPPRRSQLKDLYAFLDQIEMSIAELCRATITTSDNAAANLLLKEFGGPTGLTYLIREAGDRMTRLDRWEPELNEAAPGDERDTTTPGWMAWLMENLLFGRDEADNDIRQVHDWMNEAETGLNRLRAGLGHIYAGDKTGTNGHNTSADVAFGYSPLTMAGQDGPIVLASYINTPNPMSPETDKLHAEIGRIARAALLPDRS